MGESARPAAQDLIARLPRSFGPSLNDQLAQWDLLFPAEQRRLQAQLGWLVRLPAREFEQLFQPIVELEAKMDLPRWNPGTRGMSVTDAGILARSPYYSKWRTEVEKAFATIDASTASIRRPATGSAPGRLDPSCGSAGVQRPAVAHARPAGDVDPARDTVRRVARDLGGRAPGT